MGNYSCLRRLTLLGIVLVWFFPGRASARSHEPAIEEVRPVKEATTPGAPAHGGRRGTPAETQRFAEREQQAGALAQFEGGASISTTTLIVVLLLVIVLVLLL